jgi:predicted Zn finger-like uncharacterized protein
MTVSTQSTAVTRCPHCSAKFRVRAEQVKLHAGLVRCGACRGIFDAVEHLIEGTLPPVVPIEEDNEFAPPQTIVQGMPAMQQSDPPAVQGVASLWKNRDKTESPANTGAADQSSDEHLVVRNPDAEDRTKAAADAGELNSYRWRPPVAASTPASRWLFGALSALALLGLAAQALYFFRDDIASRVPQLAPSLVTACGYLDCRLEPPKRAEALGFVGADLAADPAHKGLLIFTATLRNTGATSVAYPHLILSLDGLGGEMVVRRVFTPTEFAPATASLARGLDAGAEVEIKLYLDASQTNVVGFKIDHAYL